MQGKNSGLPTNRQEGRKIYFHGARLETTLQGGCKSLCASGFRALAEKIRVAAKTSRQARLATPARVSCGLHGFHLYAGIRSGPLGRLQMKTRSLVFAAAMSVSTFLFSTLPGAGAELKMMTSVALTSALNELAPKYEKASGNKLTIIYGLSADMKKRILENETADVIILTPTMMNDLLKAE
jgi:hypothetical protein